MVLLFSGADLPEHIFKLNSSQKKFNTIRYPKIIWHLNQIITQFQGKTMNPQLFMLRFLFVGL
jgi:hypothetical protein